MGCDIHLHVESKGDDGEWHAVRPTRAQYREGMHLVFDRPDDAPYLDEYVTRWFDDPEVPQPLAWWDWRNYRLFWLLSGVRGPEWVNPSQICTPDLPVDVSKEILEAWQEWGLDGHTPGWLTLREAHDEQLAHAEPRCWPVLLKQWTSVRRDQDLDSVRIVLWYDN